MPHINLSLNMGTKVSNAKLFEILISNSIILIPIKHPQIAVDISSWRTEHPVEWLVGINNHGNNLNIIYVAISISIISIKKSSCDRFSPFQIGETCVLKSAFLNGLHVGAAHEWLGQLWLGGDELGGVHLNLNNKLYCNNSKSLIKLVGQIRQIKIFQQRVLQEGRVVPVREWVKYIAHRKCVHFALRQDQLDVLRDFIDIALADLLFNLLILYFLFFWACLSFWEAEFPELFGMFYWLSSF